MKLVECEHCGKKVPENKLNQEGFCIECSEQFEGMLEADRRELNEDFIGEYDEEYDEDEDEDEEIDDTNR